jgi:phosphoglucosamine mutase
MSNVRFGTDGVRGVANEALTVETALAIARAAVRVLPSDRVVIGSDTRWSGPMLTAAVTAGVCAEGADALVLGVVPTPAVAAVAARDGITGIMISASHNRFADNGIKVFAPGGRKLSDDEQAAVEAAIAELGNADSHAGPTGAGVGRPVEDPSAVPHYLSSVEAVLEGRRLDGLRVVVDCANGSNSELGPRLLRSVGAEVVVIADEPDGLNINDGCGSTSTDALRAAVVSHGAHVGIAFDGDADRLVAVDELGAEVDGDHIIALCAADLAARDELTDRTVVVTVMSNLGFLRAMQAADIRVVQTPVGDRHVLEALASGGYSLGGEQSGHIIFSRHASTGDGLLAATVLLDLLARAGRPLSELAAAAMTRLPQVLVNVTVSSPQPDVATRLAEQIAAADERLGEDGRVLLRPSGTEPVVRVMVEAADEHLAGEVAEQLADAVRAGSSTTG